MNAELLRRFESIAREIYEAGRRDGSAEMRAALLKLVGADAAAFTVSTDSTPHSRTRKEAPRAPRGALERAVSQALRAKPGQTEQEVIEAVAHIDPQISPRSVGGQLRRFRREKYRQEGRKWFLLEKPSSGPATSPDDGLL